MEKMNIIYINKMIKSSIQQDSDGATQAILSENQINQLREFLTSIDGNVELLQIENALINGKSNANKLIDKYFSTLIIQLASHKIEKFENNSRISPWGDKVCKVIEEMTPIRDKIIELLIVIYDNSSDDYNIPELIERSLQFNFEDYDHFQIPSTAGYLRNDNYRVIIYEVFLYLVAYLLKKQKYNDVHSLISKSYQVRIIRNENSTNEIKEYGSNRFSNFNYLPATINAKERREHKNILNENHDLYREFLLSRANKSKYLTVNELREADIFLYFISVFQTLDETRPYLWRPYFSSNNCTLDLMLRASSTSFFEKIKQLFNVNSVEQFKNELKKVIARQREYITFKYENNIPEVEEAFNLYNLCTQE